MVGCHFAATRDKIIVGRDRELNYLGDFLDGSVSHESTMLLSGGVGIGKTTLLDHTVALARDRGMSVVRSAELKSTDESPYSGLRKLLTPLRADTADAPERDRQVVDVALGYQDGQPAAARRVASAVVSVLRHVRAGRNLLVAIDDLHWMDRLSYQSLRLIGSRLTGTGIRMLGVTRPQAGAPDRIGFPVRDIQPLDETASRALLDQRFPSLSAQVRARILADARGNPLALTELPLALSTAQWKTVQELPRVLPLTERLQAVYGPRLSSLPSATRELLLAAALQETGELNVLKEFVGRDLEAALRGAEDAQLVEVDPTGTRMVFQHPLVRATVVVFASPSQRREMHRRLADALVERPELRAFHLSESELTANSVTARLVHDSAVWSMRRGVSATAVHLMTRSAGLSTDPRLRARRLGYAAAISAEMAGDLDVAAGLIRDARTIDPDFEGTLSAAVAAATVLLNGHGDVETGYRLLVTALESRDPADDDSGTLLQVALWTLARACWVGGRAESWAALRRLAARYRERLTEFDIAAWTVAADPAHADAADLAVIDREIGTSRTENDLVKIVRLAEAGSLVDRIGDLRADLWRVVDSGRNGQSTTLAIRALTHLCEDALARGRWADVDILGGEVQRLCADNRLRACSWGAQGSIAAVAALRGDGAKTRAVTRQMVTWAAPRDARVVLHFATRARMLEALGAADFEAAYQYAAEIGLPDPRGPSSTEQMLISLDLVDAATHTNRFREAEAQVRAIEASRMPSLSARLALHAAAAAALVAPRDEAGARFERALSLPGVSRWPHDRARVQLAYGEHLRRVRAIGDAQRQLRWALNTFRDLGATPWASRAEEELRAAGDRGIVAEPDDSMLTAQELKIVRLAASGLTNKQIGERLYLSPRTIGNHLYRAFPKLGIASRSSLRDALNLHRLDKSDDTAAEA